MKNFFKSLKSRFSVVNELFRFLWEYKMWWMMPMVIVLLLLGVLIIFTMNNPAAVPFIYTLF